MAVGLILGQVPTMYRFPFYETLFWCVHSFVFVDSFQVLRSVLSEGIVFQPQESDY